MRRYVISLQKNACHKIMFRDLFSKRDLFVPFLFFEACYPIKEKTILYITCQNRLTMIKL